MANPWGDSGKHFNVSLVEKEIHGRRGFWVHDWRPGHQDHDGSFLRFVMAYKKISYIDALRDVCGANVDVREYLRRHETKTDKEDTPEEVVVALPKGAKRISERSDSLARLAAMNYLSSRCIDDDTSKQYFLHYDSTSIIFPYLEYGMLVYWQSRSLLGKVFEFPPESIGVTKSEFLYGFDYVEPNEPLIVCEAIIDSINIGPGAVAFGGSRLSTKQVRKIKALNPSCIILAADNDKPDKHGNRAGIMSILKNYELLKHYFRRIYYAMPFDPFKDWNDMAVAGANVRSFIDDSIKSMDLKTIISLKRK
jgi:hypothetical protein